MDKLRKHIEEITPVSDEEFEYVKTFLTRKRVRKHQYLIQVGDIVTCDYWITRGIFRAFYVDKTGKEHILQFALENSWLSDYNAFFNQTESKMNIVCMEDAEVLCLTLLAKEKLASELHKMEHFFRMKVTRGYTVQQHRIISLLSNNPRQRYEEFESLYPNIVKKVPKKYIAEYLGISRETLSRLYPVSHRHASI
ncbi:Crp/Fnr family transcriptional regulator [Dyadobacter pollutisoli]|uniref:Crp/Fnr family transcriptional regulator n=1 Tax=Dyadobacter pollutisoli TaxID=2910158 RepID=A0A9E8SKG9_9BACT|nr:Crp/Fnr family transcriptional regulator [Dyadobacter pollutisoli]WAC12465.1 Crp/Fnr family transcriptional regulator [Dyadobacter pollutisoli]